MPGVQSSRPEASNRGRQTKKHVSGLRVWGLGFRGLGFRVILAGF